MDTGNTLLCNSTAVLVFNIKPRFFHLFLFHSYWTEIITSFTYECIQFPFFFPPSCKLLLIRISFCGFCNKSPVNVTIAGNGRAEWERRSFFMYIVCKYICKENTACVCTSLPAPTSEIWTLYWFPVSSTTVFKWPFMTRWENIPLLSSLENLPPSFLRTKLYLYTSTIHNSVSLFELPGDVQSWWIPCSSF